MPKKPAPYQAPRIEISSDSFGGPKKEWQYLRATEIEVGDIVAGYGLVVGIGSRGHLAGVPEPAEEPLRQHLSAERLHVLPGPL